MTNTVTSAETERWSNWQRPIANNHGYYSIKSVSFVVAFRHHKITGLRPGYWFICTEAHELSV